MRELSQQLEIGTHNALHFTAWWLRDLTGTTAADLVKSREIAAEKHAAASQLAAQLMTTVRDEAIAEQE